MTLPHGTLTFLFTDIQGSTQLWEQYPEAMSAALAAHDDVMRRAIETHGGCVFKTVGDAFCAAFSVPHDALKAALAAQSALTIYAWGETGALRVRMAVHTGTAQQRDGDYFGPTLNRTARLQGLAHGGQILLSQAVVDLVQDHAPEDMAFRFLGAQRLKDLQRPEPAYQLLHPDLPAEFPPLQSLNALLNNLPLQMTGFVGREAELREIQQQLSQTRLLTLVGSGGTGKTRLGLQVGAEMLERFAEGVWLVELASLSDPALVAQSVASVLRVQEEPGRAWSAMLAEQIGNKSLLLFLDNCEHLIGACACLADTLLKSCPGLHILASSREGLGITGEITYRVPSLARPDPRHLPSGMEGMTALMQCESARLFHERAIAVQPHFAITPSNAPAIAQICHRLDGIPLAIELAAVRVKALSVEQIAARLDDCFRLLTGGNRAALPRQQTLRALIDWSYDLLNAQEQALLCRLSVFVGGWTLDACEHIAGEDMAAWESLDVLCALVDKSLAVCEEHGSESRYRLLETIRQYAREKITASEQQEACKRHRDYFVAMAEEAKPKLRGALQAETLALLEAEWDNLRAALDFCCHDSDSAEHGLRLAGALWRVFSMRGYLAEGRTCMSILLNHPNAQFQTRVRADALTGAGNLAQTQGDVQQARGLHEESLAIHRLLGGKQGIAGALCNLGLLAKEQGDYDSAWKLLKENLAIQREINDKQGIARALGNLGMLAQDTNNSEYARVLHEESLAIRRELQDTQGVAIALGNLGLVALQQEDCDNAKTCLEECLTLCRSLEEQIVAPYALERFAMLATKRQQLQRATQLYGAAAALREASGAPLPTEDQKEVANTLAELEQNLGECVFEVAYRSGHSLPLQQAIKVALASGEALALEAHLQKD